MNIITCPLKTCNLRVLNGKIYCVDHKKFLEIKNDWENKTYNVPMMHILYIAASNGKDGEILIDEEV